MRLRFTLTWKLNLEAISEAEREDGVFPVLTNDRKARGPPRCCGLKIRQPLLEKRFSQFKTDYAAAPVYLKNVSRIQGLLAAYFFALLVQTLLERELREAMARAGEEKLPLYPEGRACARPTTHRLIKVFAVDPAARGSGRRRGAPGDGTKLTKTQLAIIRLLGLDPRTYGLRSRLPSPLENAGKLRRRPAESKDQACQRRKCTAHPALVRMIGKVSVNPSPLVGATPDTQALRRANLRHLVSSSLSRDALVGL